MFIIVTLKFYAIMFTFTKLLLGTRQKEEANIWDVRVEEERMGIKHMIVCAEFLIPSMH